MATQLIDREQVLKEFEEMRKGFTQTSDYATGIKSGIDACTYRVINLPIQQSNELNHPTIISGGFQPDGWIDVRERLPELKEEVLVNTIDLNVSVMRLQKGFELEWSQPGFGYSFDFITHWQPLPTPPITNN